MKKTFWLLFLGLGICWAGMTTNLSAAEIATENEETIQEISVDLSDELIQKGGFPSESNIGGKQAKSLMQEGISTRLSDKEKQVQALLMKAWDSFSGTCDLSACQVTADELHTIYANTLNSNPKYFYVDGGYSYGISGNNTVSSVRILYAMDEATAKPMRENYDRTVTNIVSRTNSSWSDLEKALYLNDYLARNCEYDKSLSKYTAYDALVGGTAVCQGYALAFLDLAHELGLSCEMASSQALNHAWNFVKVKNSYYHVDVTWNDPVADRLGRARHVYFLKSTGFFQSENGGHTAEDWVLTGGIAPNAASETKYDNYFWNQSDTGFEYINGSWYGFDGADSIVQYACNGTDFTAVKPLITIDDVWNVVGNPNGYWPGKYIGTGSYDGKLYYSGKNDIYEWNPQTARSVVIFSLPEAQKQTGYIYGINIQNSGELKYLLSPSPNDDGTVHVAKSFAPTPINISSFQLVLEKKNYVYDGRAKCPNVTVKNNRVVLSSSDYTVTYGKNIHAGTATVTVRGTGNYSGTITGTFQIQKADNRITATARYTKTAKSAIQSFRLNVSARAGSIKYQSNNKNVAVNSNGTVSIPKDFVGTAVITATAGNSDYKSSSTKITITVNPTGVKLSLAKNLSGKKLSFKWKKNAKAAGYQIQYATNRKFKSAKIKKVSSAAKTKLTIKGLKKKKTYYVRIRTYKNVSGTPYYSEWSSSKKIKITK